MRKIIVFIAAPLVLNLACGCARQNKAESRIVIQINGFKMTEQEFEEAFKGSGTVDTIMHRRQFLDNLINRKLILQEAERENLNKDRSFLKTIEGFYEQSLLKGIFDKKTREIAGGISVSEGEIEALYNEMIKKGSANKPLNEVYNEIRWRVLREKQTSALDAWVGDLRKKARIKIDREFAMEDKR